jgi:hypothetical protein
MFSLPGSSRIDRRRISESGFATKREAEDAEARRRIGELQKLELAKAGSGFAAAPPRNLAMLLLEFFAQHVDDNLAPKTAERYHEQAAYINPGLLAMPLADITPLHLNREWRRLMASGGHHRRSKAPRPSLRRRSGILLASFPAHFRALSGGASLL